MSEARFTPGPWAIPITHKKIEGGIDLRRFDDTATAPFVPVGACGCCDSPWMAGKDRETCEADAALIAAAPDLYAALEDALEQMIAYWQDIEDEFGPGGTAQDDTPAIRNARAALAKARGEV